MNLHFLDLVDEPLARESNGLWLLVIVFAVTILAEAVVMLLMKYNRFKKTLLDSFLVNLGSLGVGFVVEEFAHGLLNSYQLKDLLVLCILTMVIEMGILYLLNRKKPFVKTLRTVVVMNLASYFLFYLFILTR